MYKEEVARFEREGFELVAFTADDEYIGFHDEPPGQHDSEETHEFYEMRKRTFNISWWFIGVIVEANFILEDADNVPLGSASLWGIESDGMDYVRDEVIPELAEEAIYDARQHLKKILQSVEALKSL